MRIRNRIKGWLHTVGFDVVRYVPECNRPFDVLSLVVREFMRKIDEPFFFVQVGANDGILDDPLRKLVLEHHLNGLLIEPLPDLFERLVENYAESRGLIFENVAIDTKPGTVPIHRVRKGPSTPKHWDGIASLDKRHLIKEGVNELNIETVEVKAVTMQSLLSKHNIKKIDLLQVDTEGYDYAIVKSVIEAGFRPGIINYEHCHLVPKIRLASKRLLEANDYRFIEVGKDSLAVRGWGI
ncbi:MAG: FkbM family methyltransferase [Pseudomonadota bacterium]